MSGKWGEMEILRKVGAVLLMSYGVLGTLAALVGLMPGEEASLHLAEILMTVGFGLSGWLLWRRSGRNRVGGALLISVGAFALLMGVGELATRNETVIHLLMMELRVGLPALVSGWLLWSGRPARQIGATWVVLWAASITIQAVAYADEPLTTVVLVTRAGVPGFLCGWLLWRGGAVRQIGAVLLVSWPMSYMIYALRGEDLDNAIGELVVGVPTVIVGCLLWRERESDVIPSARTIAAAPAVDVRNEL